MTSAVFNRINNSNIYDCKLKLENGTEFSIPMREDGYIHADKLCKAASKRLSNWRRTNETKNLIERLCIMRECEVSLLVETYKGNTTKYKQGTWIHPDLGIQLAQWCSPLFSLQVSKWVRELIITGQVVQGEEKSNDELTNQLQEKLKIATNTIISLENENKYTRRKYKKLEYNHQLYLKRKELYKLRRGSCVYLINMIGKISSRR